MRAVLRRRTESAPPEIFKIGALETHNNNRRVPRGHAVWQCGCVSRRGCFFLAHETIEPAHIDAWRAELWRSDYDSVSRRPTSKASFRALANMGINIVVDLRGRRESERRMVTNLGMQYVAMPWRCSFPKDKTFAQFLTLLRNNRGKKIFVHCRLGDDRTGMMISSFITHGRRGLVRAERAEKEMENFGFSFAHRRLICPGLSSYEEKFPRRFRTRPAFQALR